LYPFVFVRNTQWHRRHPRGLGLRTAVLSRQTTRPSAHGRWDRRRRRLTATVPVRFPAELLEQVRAAAAAEDRSVSSWIRRAVESELRHPAW